MWFKDEWRSSDGIDHVASGEFNCFLRKSLHFSNHNARSLLPELDKLTVLASKAKADVFGVNETWIYDLVEDSEVELPR